MPVSGLIVRSLGGFNINRLITRGLLGAGAVIKRRLLMMFVGS